MKCFNIFILLLGVSLLLFAHHIEAKFSCIPFISSPQARCEDIGTGVSPGGTPVFDTMGECLNGGVIPDTNYECKNDPRYQLRNFAPFLNFPNVGSMLNLGTSLITTIAGILCGLVMLAGAYEYLAAGGEAKKIESARNRMVYAGIGLLIVLFAYTIVRLILDITSTNTVGF